MGTNKKALSRVLSCFPVVVLILIFSCRFQFWKNLQLLSYISLNLKEKKSDEVVLTEKDVPEAYLSKDPPEYTVPMLKRWLECHGQKTTGNLSALVETVRGCIALKLKVDPRVDGGKWYELKKKGHSLNTASSTTKASSSSDTKPTDDWIVFLSVDIPEMFMNYEHAYYHLIKSVANFGLNESGSDSTDDSDGYGGYTTT